MYVSLCVYSMYTYVCVYIYIEIKICIHTYTHIYIYILLGWALSFSLVSLLRKGILKKLTSGLRWGISSFNQAVFKEQDKWSQMSLQG